MKGNGLRLAVMLLLTAVASLGLDASNSLTVSPIEGDTGSEVEVTVALDNSDALGALQVTIALPDASAAEVVEATAAPLGRAGGFSASAGVRSGRISAMLYSLTGKTIAPGSGPVMSFRVRLGSKPVDATVKSAVKATAPDGSEIACAGADVTLRSLCPVLELNAAAIDFGRVALESTARRSIGFRNAGTAELAVTGVEMGRADFRVVTPLPISVAPGAYGSVELEFAPKERGQIVFPAQIASNSVAAGNVVEITATPYAVNTLTLGSVSGVCDSEVEVPLTVANMDRVNGFTIEMKLPKGLEYVDGSFALNAGRSSGHISTASCNDGVLRLTAYSLTNEPFKGSDGEIGSVKLRLKGKGTYTLTTSKAVLSAFYKGEIINVISDSYSGRVSITYPSISVNSSMSLGRTAIPARASSQLRITNNGNSPLTISDLVLESEEMTIAENLPLIIPARSYADVTVSCEGEATGDFKGVLNIYSNDPDRRLAVVNVSAKRYADNHLTFAAGKAAVTDRQTYITVDLSNYSALKGIQFDLQYPSTLLTPLDEATAFGRAEGFQVMKRDISAGVVRYFVFAISGKEIAPGTGPVLRLPFGLSEGNTAGRLTIMADNFSLGSASMENMNSQLTSVPFELELTEKPLLKGDLDGNGFHTVSDAIQAISIQTGKAPVEDNLPVTDMNDDGDITVSDILAIIALIIKN